MSRTISKTLVVRRSYTESYCPETGEYQEYDFRGSKTPLKRYTHCKEDRANLGSDGKHMYTRIQEMYYIKLR
jgi:hypothetical protein